MVTASIYLIDKLPIVQWLQFELILPFLAGMLREITGVMALVAIFIGYNFFRTPSSIKLPNQLNPQYDYIIIGAGSAGAVLAARLSEDPKVSVALLEAGNEPPIWSSIPGAAPFLQLRETDWKYRTVPSDKCCQSMENSVAAWPSGKLLGGSSILNYMHYVRGNRRDFDSWVEEGLKGWGYADLLPFFKKVEGNLEEKFRKSEYRGVDGPLKITGGVKSLTKLGELIKSALLTIGLPWTEDYNGAEQEGFGYCQVGIENGKRQSSYSAYLQPAMNRDNLHVVTGAHVSKILFNEDNQAVGVQFTHSSNDRVAQRLLTNREIIISAGAIGSPKILLLSGVGPKEHLDDLKIPLVLDLPAVGQHLVDQTISELNFQLNTTVGIDLPYYLTVRGVIHALVEYLLKGTGPLGMTPLEVTGFLSSPLNSLDRPDMQFYVFPVWPFIDELRTVTNMKLEDYEASSGTCKTLPSSTFATVLLHPASVGEVRLKSKDPADLPFINPNTLEKEEDVEKLLWGTKLLLNLSRSEILKPFGFEISEKPLPGCKQHKFLSDDYLRCSIRHRTLTIYHYLGTCRMGLDPKNSVVDASLRVHGVKNLRVVDASIFPSQITGNPNALIMATAEKAAQMILEFTEKPIH